MASQPLNLTVRYKMYKIKSEKVKYIHKDVKESYLRELYFQQVDIKVKSDIFRNSIRRRPRSNLHRSPQTVGHHRIAD